ncbi:Crp/Fnr family transcriptional regulator [Facklamia miroungae]|uniref:CRP/FNR family transcriptional regulator, anaerobic regulatory protein n=1 Tax=Facklamia miroungae TaxID=120956 RepID=A0A1G7PDS7_9LACT|nr:Crp/Fnr family transcriptional regulator [Facklamia miroungae]NKZ28676.1 Crp/Fnr family transcriptional regulator [Facklamia miroungae]SDF84433.1 CRP/FNR family transcriptional regulator, anaerobic regulatory protein [Facklamia miroungae]
MSHEHACIRQVPILNHLDDHSMDLIGEKVIRKDLEKGEFLFQAGDQTDTLYIIHSGAIRVFRIAESGKEQLLQILRPGDFLGERTIFNESVPHEDYAQAQKKTRVCMLKQSDFNKFLLEFPQIAIKLLGEMSNRLENSEKQTTQVSIEQVGNRLISYLMDQVDDKNQGPIVVNLDMSRKDIASFLGTSPETLSRKFKEFEEAGLIHQLSPKQIEILDLDELLFYKA